VVSKHKLKWTYNYAKKTLLPHTIKENFMEIDELRHIIKKHGTYSGRPTDYKWHNINGCKLLEHIEDVPGFVPLLRKFRKYNGTANSLTDYYPDVIKWILDGDVIFGMNSWQIHAHVNGNYFGISF
jgi:hypothetical protein